MRVEAYKSYENKDNNSNSSNSGLASFCPVIKKKKEENGNKNNDDTKNSSTTTTSNKSTESKCPVKKGSTLFNVYSQPIDPKNNMPANPNQLPREGQRRPIETSRVKSSIPKGGTDDDTWTYPSPQMFYNALNRKGKGEGVDEDDVEGEGVDDDAEAVVLDDAEAVVLDEAVVDVPNIDAAISTRKFVASF